tara:strand:- start:212 stop:505 length:294 start_codon:yes stop_codon:yes gene_type:complete
MKRIRIYLVKNCKLLKSKSAIPYIDELTVFIKVRIESLKEFSKSIPLIVNIVDNKKRDIMKTIIVRKYLFISSKSKLILVKINLFINIFLGLLNDKI